MLKMLEFGEKINGIYLRKKILINMFQKDSFSYGRETGFKMSNPEVKQTENNCLPKDFCWCSWFCSTCPPISCPLHSLQHMSCHLSSLLIVYEELYKGWSCIWVIVMLTIVVWFFFFILPCRQTMLVDQTSMPVGILFFIQRDSVMCCLLCTKHLGWHKCLSWTKMKRLLKPL